ncbi:hypothetical protein FB45DRAFT_886435 [Roridomyces roridus]|uniref:Uncharacterized protein n=1 Tax=Roridomyces roridus TaxID=1738132 RepID=A0AAD7CIC0_9AGAR|nr:hypothetical protein FB45DRAFT_886435 [Roridomyces roridus]
MLPRLPSPPPTAAMSARKVARPRGLWKGRGTPKHGLALDSDDDPRPRKRQRYQRSDDTDDDDDEYYLLEYSPEPPGSPYSDMDSEPDPAVETKVEDWEDLKELFGRAAEQYDCDDVTEALPLLRGVIHECHRFLLLYEDPSVLFAEPNRPRSKSPEPISPTLNKPRKKCKCKESPTAFHAILGTALFLFGNLIAQDPSLALPDEPSSAAPYWLAALDVFETSENLPSRTSGRGCEAPEDWRMALVWGRTLLCITDEVLTLAANPSAPPPPPEPKWPSPASSPFAAIAMRRPPSSRRISLTTSIPHDLLLLAMDQFTRGIFHMPHPAHEDPASASTSSDPRVRPFSRAKELFTIAREVLALAERLPAPEERTRWAAWADGILNQMDMEGDTARAEWRGPVTRARGRCWLVVGTARVEDIEEAAEARGWDAVLDEEDADEAREGLGRAIEFFERAAGSAKGEFGGEDGEEMTEELKAEEEELRAFLAEALLTLANLTKEEDKREDLYSRAQALGADDLEDMDVDDDDE